MIYGERYKSRKKVAWPKYFLLLLILSIGVGIYFYFPLIRSFWQINPEDITKELHSLQKKGQNQSPEKISRLIKILDDKINKDPLNSEYYLAAIKARFFYLFKDTRDLLPWLLDHYWQKDFSTSNPHSITLFQYVNQLYLLTDNKKDERLLRYYAGVSRLLLFLDQDSDSMQSSFASEKIEGKNPNTLDWVSLSDDEVVLKLIQAAWYGRSSLLQDFEKWLQSTDAKSTNIKKAISFFRKNSELLFAFAAIKAGSSNAAIRLLYNAENRINTKDPLKVNVERLLSVYATVLLENRLWDRLSALLQKHSLHWPAKASYSFFSGLLKLNKEDFKGAEADLLKALSLDPQLSYAKFLIKKIRNN